VIVAQNFNELWLNSKYSEWSFSSKVNALPGAVREK
jgi:hypothetical protein